MALMRSPEGLGRLFLDEDGWARPNRGVMDPPIPSLPLETARVEVSWLYFGDAIVSGATLKAFISSAWTAKPLKYWDGSAWVVKPLKWYTGSTWA